jgi:colanic acid/amylovoran biosynthesis glycosyltransferase
MTPENTRRVVVFRKRMLPYSETFIAAQGRHLPSWKAVFSGATEDKSGAELLRGADVCTLSREVPSWRKSIDAFAFKRLGVVPGKWLSSLKSYRPELVHTHFGPDGLFMGLPLSRKLGVPLIVTFHGFDITIDDPSSPYQKNRGRLFREAERIIAVSDYIRRRLIEHGCPEEKITRHFIGIDLGHFTPLPEDTPREGVVFVGRLTEKKGCRYLIEAMHLLAENGSNETLHVIGDGALREELGRIAEPLGDRVVFHGRKGPDFVREMVGRAAVFCAPSVTSRSGDAEGLGMVNLEAMALGTPVVSTFHTAIPEAVIHEKTGILVAEKDVAELAAALSRCLGDADLSRTLGRNGIGHVRSNFDLRRQCAVLEGIYEGTVAAARR